MPRSYFRTLPDLYERKAFGVPGHQAYTAAALACFIGVLCFGEQQQPRGRFKSLRLLRALIEGPHGTGRVMAKCLPFLIEQGDLIQQPDGALYIEGWDELQEGNWQVAERMTRYRARKDAAASSKTLDSAAVTPAVTANPSCVVGEVATGVGLVADIPSSLRSEAVDWPSIQIDWLAYVLDPDAVPRKVAKGDSSVTLTRQAEKIARIGDYYTARLGRLLREGDGGRLASLLKSHPGKERGLLEDIGTLGFDDPKGDPIDYLTAKLARRKTNGERSHPRPVLGAETNYDQALGIV